MKKETFKTIIKTTEKANIKLTNNTNLFFTTNFDVIEFLPRTFKLIEIGGISEFLYSEVKSIEVFL